MNGTRRIRAAAVLVAAALGTGSLAACASDADGRPPATTIAIDGVETFTGLTNRHTKSPVAYPQSPPVGGDHNPAWQNCGVYDTPVANENAVHSLEHGAVWLAYRPDLPADQVEVLRALARGHSHILVSPYPGLTEAVVATAWGKQLRVDFVTDPRLVQFIANYEEGPQAPESGVTCSGAVGSPIE